MFLVSSIEILADKWFNMKKEKKNYCPISGLTIKKWWLIVSALDFWGRGHELESGISLIDPGSLQDHCVILYNSQGTEGDRLLRQKNIKLLAFKKNKKKI